MSKPSRLECNPTTVHVDTGLTGGRQVPENCPARVRCSNGRVVAISPVVPGPVVNACAQVCHCT